MSCQHACQSGCHPCSCNDDSKSIFFSMRCKICSLCRSTMRRINMCFVWNTILFENLDTFRHYRQITVTAHDNRYFFHLFYLPETFKKQSVPSGLQTAVIYTKTTTSNAQKKGICTSSLFSCLESHNTSRHSSILLTRQGLRYQTFHRLLSY